VDVLFFSCVPANRLGCLREREREMTTYIANGVDANVVLLVLAVLHEGLNWKTCVSALISYSRFDLGGLTQKVPQDTTDMLNLLLLSSTLSNPGPRLSPRLVESEKTALSSSLDPEGELAN
jgi:hypothetical protein